MRRLSSIFISAAIAISGLTLTSTGVSAAGGTATVKRSTTVAPTAIANANALRTVRLSKTNQILAIGNDTAVASGRLHLWKINDDATVDTKFGAIDLGNNATPPTSSNSSCVSGNLGYCFSVQALQVNETADRYVATWNRSLSGTGQYSSSTIQITTVVIGKISTGEVLGSINLANSNSGMDMASWSQYNISTFSTTACTTAIGATLGGIALAYSYAETYGIVIRPDGSLMMSVSCDYRNNWNSSPSAVVQHRASLYAGLKPSANSFVLDTSFGTNGYLVVFKDTTSCAWNMANGSVNSGLTSNSSTAVFAPLLISNFPRQTQIPSWMQNQGVTSYNGCDTNGGSSTTNTTQILAIQANGVVKNTTTFPSGTDVYVPRWIIDPQGRWNAIAMGGPGGPMQGSNTKFIRLLADGKPDTSIGANGMKTMSSLPTTLTVNGAQVNMQYSLLGFATTAKGIVFSGISSVRTSAGSCTNGQGSNDFSTTYYPYYLNLEDGLDTTYGTNGLGEGVKIENSRTETCGSNFIGRSTFINSKGQPALMGQLAAVGSQARGFISATWDAASGVTSGGEGVGAVGVANRVDKTVYSTKLPAVAQADSALTVLTAKQAEDLDIRTNTPKICVALTTSVVMVNPGRCSVRIIDEDTKKVIRTMTTIVKKTEVEDGTTLTTDEPIYFRQANTRLSKNALAQVAELATAAKDAARVVIIGHSAALGEVSEYSYAISRNRANAVKAALIKAGVKTPIEIVAMAYSQPEKTAKTEKAQALNRRAEVYIFPK